MKNVLDKVIENSVILQWCRTHRINYIVSTR